MTDAKFAAETIIEVASSKWKEGSFEFDALTVARAFLAARDGWAKVWALIPFVKHAADCERYADNPNYPPLHPCTCGLEAVLAQAAQPTQEAGECKRCGEVFEGEVDGCRDPHCPRSK